MKAKLRERRFIEKSQSMSIKRIFFLFFALSLILSGCGASKPKSYTIGVVNYLGILQPIYDGFKAGLADLGYVEGENITFIYNGVVEPERSAIEAEIQNLVDQDVDLIYAMGTLPTLVARDIVAGTDIPVVFAPVIDPVGEGAVDSIAQPGGNVTGVQNANFSPKGLEWLLKIVPETEVVYVFYHPDDEVSLTVVQPLPEAAASLGVELALTPVNSAEDALPIVQTLPPGASILIIPTPTLGSFTPVKELAVELNIPIGSHEQPAESTLFSYSVDWPTQGRQAARMADQIFNGAKPADLPVETAELFLTINLPIAQELGVVVPDEILNQADTIIR